MAKDRTYDREQIYQKLYGQFMEKEVPPCTRCGSGATASVQVGIVWITIRLATTCPKFKLIPNGPKPGEWFCNLCGRYFDVAYDVPRGGTPS